MTAVGGLKRRCMRDQGGIKMGVRGEAWGGVGNKGLNAMKFVIQRRQATSTYKEVEIPLLSD